MTVTGAEPTPKRPTDDEYEQLKVAESGPARPAVADPKRLLDLPRPQRPLPRLTGRSFGGADRQVLGYRCGHSHTAMASVPAMHQRAKLTNSYWFHATPVRLHVLKQKGRQAACRTPSLRWQFTTIVRKSETFRHGFELIALLRPAFGSALKCS